MFYLLQTGVACLCLLKMLEKLPVVFFKKGVLNYFAKSFFNKVASLRPKHAHINWKFQRPLKLSIESFNIGRTFFKKFTIIWYSYYDARNLLSRILLHLMNLGMILFTCLTHSTESSKTQLLCLVHWKKRFSSRWLLIWNAGLKIQIAW